MSVRVMAAVWECYPEGGSELLALLALADWSDDEGRCWPSVESIARKMRLSEKQARRVVHSLISAGYVMVTDNMLGGAASRRYQVNLAKLATPPADGRGISPQPLPPMGAHPSHGWEPTPPAHGSRTIIDTSMNHQIDAQALPASSGKSKSGRKAITLKTFIEQCKAAGEKNIPENDPIFSYAEKVGVDTDMLAVCWAEFKAAYLPTTKKQKDWRAHFRNAVRKNWYKLWFIKPGELAQWTTAGEQARRAAA